MATEDKIVENMGVVSDKLVQYMDAAEKVISQYGGDAVNLGLNVLRIEAAQGIATGIITAILVFVCYKIFPKKKEPTSYGKEIDVLICKGSNRRSSMEDDLVEEATGNRYANKSLISGDVDWDQEALVARGVISAIAGGGFLIASAINLFSIWNWVGVFWPEAYAVHKFLM